MKRMLTLTAVLGLVACSAGVANADLLVNGNLDAGSGQSITGWTKDESKSDSGPTTDLVTLEPWIEIAPITNGGGDADQGGFVKSFQGNINLVPPDLATLHLYQDVAGTPDMKYILTGHIGAGLNYSGLLDGPTKTELALEFDTDGDRGNGLLGSAVLDVKAAGLTSGAFPDFGAQEFMVMAVSPAGTTVVRARFSAIDMYATQNPDQAAFIDDFSLICVPEPATVALVGLALVGLAGFRRRSN